MASAALHCAACNKVVIMLQAAVVGMLSCRTCCRMRAHACHMRAGMRAAHMRMQPHAQSRDSNRSVRFGKDRHLCGGLPRHEARVRPRWLVKGEAAQRRLRLLLDLLLLVVAADPAAARPLACECVGVGGRGVRREAATAAGTRLRQCSLRHARRPKLRMGPAATLGARKWEGSSACPVGYS